MFKRNAAEWPLVIFKTVNLPHISGNINPRNKDCTAFQPVFLNKRTMRKDENYCLHCDNIAKELQTSSQRALLGINVNNIENLQAQYGTETNRVSRFKGPFRYENNLIFYRDTPKAKFTRNPSDNKYIHENR